MTSKSKLAAIGVIATGFAGSTMITPLYAFYQDRFGFSPTILTIIYAAYVIGNLVALLFLGRLSDRVGRRRIAFSALGASAVATLLFVFAQHEGWLFAGRAMSGLAVGLGSGVGTAWLVDLHPGYPSKATLLATQANLGGVGSAPLFAGIFAAYFPAPLTFTFVAFLIVLIGMIALVASAEETVAPKRISADIFYPRLALPGDARTAFVAPAASAFVTFGFVGFYAALLPSILKQAMHITHPTVGGAILAELFAVAMVMAALTRRVNSRTAMLTGLAMVVPGLALLVGAQAEQSLALLIAGTACGGITVALGYRGGLEIVNRMAPPDARAGLVSVYFVICFVGNSLPVVGVGIATTAFGPIIASEIFASIMLILTTVGFVVGLKSGPASGGRCSVSGS